MAAPQDRLADDIDSLFAGDELTPPDVDDAPTDLSEDTLSAARTPSAADAIADAVQGAGAKPARKRTRPATGDASSTSKTAGRTTAKQAPPVVAANADPNNGVSAVDALAEAHVLSALFVDPDLLVEAEETLDGDDFGVGAHGAIYRALIACDAAGRPLDKVTVGDALQRSGELANIGGVATIDAIVATDPAIAEFSSYLEIVRERAIRRRLLGAARTIATDALSGQADSVTLVENAEKAVYAVSAEKARSSMVEMPIVMANLHEQMRKVRSAQLLGYSTGISELDRLTGGLVGGQFIIIAARPGMGKSVLALQLARHISEVNDVAVPLLSYEMTQTEIGYRLLSSATGISLQELMRSTIPDGSDRALAHEAQKMAQLRLLLDDRPPQTISGVRSAMRRLARRGPLGAIVVDYLQLMSGDGGRRDENRQQEVSSISRGLKQMADELNVPVIACAQLSRQLESRPDKRPLLSDLRESGSLEQDASLCLFLYRDHVYNPESPETDAELIVAKNRNGPAGKRIPLDFEGKAVRFLDSNRQVEGPRKPQGVPAGQFPGASGGYAAGGSRENPFASF